MITRETAVRNYTDEELINRIKSLPSFTHIPLEYWILGVQSNEDNFNKFDDKFYLFKGTECIGVTSGTTNAGTSGLKNFQRYNRYGCLVVKTNEWYYDLWKPGYHKGKMKALRQNKPIKYFRDWNKNNRVEQIGKMYQGMRGINFHTAIYGVFAGFWRKLIGGWSTGCQVPNDNSSYYEILDKVWYQPTTTYCLIKEF